MFVISCPVDPAQGKKILEILNRILEDRIDPKVVMAKLDDIRKALPPPRRELSDYQVKEFAYELAGVKSAVTLIAAASSDDIAPLFQRICQAAQDAQWGCMQWQYGDIKTGAGMPSGKGISCYASNWKLGDAARLKAAMAAVNLDCETNITGSYTWGGATMNGGGLTIVVGTPSP
ncbi:MAG: hypothetical protein ABSC76_16785 [Terracidiphilus sp.]